MRWAWFAVFSLAFLMWALTLTALLWASAEKPAPSAVVGRVPPAAAATWWTPTQAQRDFARESGWPLWFETKVGLRFVLVPPGAFIMGSHADEPERSDDEQRHRVTIADGFYVSATEVTNGQFRRYWPAHDSGAYDGQSLNGDDQPVVNMAWCEARRFCRWLGVQSGQTHNFALPSEEQWEYSCRAGAATAYWWGQESGSANHNGFGAADGFLVTAPVASYAANRWGLFDTAGNAWEWCADVHGAYGEPRLVAASGIPGGAAMVLRGGSWFAVIPGRCRSAARGRSPSQSRLDSHGFRVMALSPPTHSPESPGAR